MKRKITFLGITIAVFLGLVLFSGCAEKKAVVVDDTAEKTAPVDTEKEAVTPTVIGGLQGINFDFDRSNIRADARPIMKDNADFLLQNRNINIIIEGHCDERGTAEYNMALG
ncbi:MAG TPA: peptidoglycan-associated lipoprotein, partial [Deltaproteobacteria bacterium]|nr:peptidoglycan-associated lipoprotein [Deltaproteobacteria bacterium]